MGPYLRIQGAVLLDHVICGAFTDYIWLGGDPYLDENVMSVSRIFSTITKTIRNLHLYYDNSVLSDSPVSFQAAFIRRINLIFILASPKS